MGKFFTPRLTVPLILRMIRMNGLDGFAYCNAKVTNDFQLTTSWFFRRVQPLGPAMADKDAESEIFHMAQSRLNTHNLKVGQLTFKCKP